MWRFSARDCDRHHASEAAVLDLIERLVVGDQMEVRKEIGSGYHVVIEEALPLKPPKDFEG